MNLDFDALDSDGYPTEEYLRFIKDYDGKTAIMEFVAVLMTGWWAGDWGFVLHRKHKGVRKLELHTGGWSGNADVIQAILSNIFLTHFNMRYKMWKTGGHYYFEIDADQK